MIDQNKTVIMLGDINVDNIWPVPAIPEPGRDGLAESVKMETGGAILNSAIMLDRLGRKTKLLGCVGEDMWASYIRQSLSGFHIDLSALQSVTSEHTGLDFILVTPDGERTMFGYRGANKLLDPENIPPDIFNDAALLHISGYAFLEAPQSDAVWRAIELAEENHVPVSLDTGLEPVMRKKGAFQRALPKLSVCIAGLEEMEYLAGVSTAHEAAEALLDLGVSLAAIKLGGRGSLVMDKDSAAICPSFPVDAVDTTGAGDAFSAGLIEGWLRGLSLLAAGMLASALGALAVTKEGAGLSLPTREDVLRFISNHEWPKIMNQDQVRAELIDHI